MTDALFWFVFLYAVAMTLAWAHAMLTRQRKTPRGRNGRYCTRADWWNERFWLDFPVAPVKDCPKG